MKCSQGHVHVPALAIMEARPGLVGASRPHFTGEAPKAPEGQAAWPRLTPDLKSSAPWPMCSQNEHSSDLYEAHSTGMCRGYGVPAASVQPEERTAPFSCFGGSKD